MTNPEEENRELTPDEVEWFEREEELNRLEAMGISRNTIIPKRIESDSSFTMETIRTARRTLEHALSLTLGSHNADQTVYAWALVERVIDDLGRLLPPE